MAKTTQKPTVKRGRPTKNVGVAAVKDVTAEDVLDIDSTVRTVRSASHIGGQVVVRSEKNKEDGSIKLFFDNGVITVLTAAEQKALKISLS